MPYNADLEDGALVYATQLVAQGDLSTSTIPTAARATTVWTRQYDVLRGALLRAGISAAVTASSAAEGWLQDVEAKLTSAYCLLSKGTVQKEEFAYVARLLDEAKEALASLPTLRPWLLSHGASASLPGASLYARSSWTEQKDPDFDESPGTGDIPYAAVPEIEVGGDL